jgi:drug/metabolite transporter (DMT)-like permease
MKKWLGIFQVLLSGVGFGFLGIFGRWAFKENLTIGELLFWRFVFAGGILWGLWGVSYLLGRPRRRLTREQSLISFALGLFGYAVFSTLYFEAIKGVSVALAAMLLFTFPIFVSLGSHFIFKDRMSRAQWLSLAVASGGLVLLLWGNISIHSTKALVMGLSAGLTYAIYVLVSGHTQQNVNSWVANRYVISGAALGLYLFHRPALAQVTTFTSSQWSLLIGIALVCSIGPMSLFLSGLQKMKSSRASVLVMIEPVVATGAAWLLLGESLSLHQLAGAALVMAALVTNSLTR